MTEQTNRQPNHQQSHQPNHQQSHQPNQQSSQPPNNLPNQQSDKHSNQDQINKALSAPNALGNVWPKQYCPAFIPRIGQSPEAKECWYCRHADFHLDKPRALEVGVCYWPKKILD